MAPTKPGLRESASAFITPEFGLKHWIASPGAMPDERQSDVVGHF
jgi:hypothetical protein